MKFKLLGVNFKLPDAYKKSSGNRVILAETESGGSSEINLENSKEPTIKASDGSVVYKGVGSGIPLDASAKSISTSEKYSMGSYEFTFLVRKFVNPKQACRALKSEVEKYNKVTLSPETEGYMADKGDGNHVLCYVQNQSLVVITTNDLENINGAPEPIRNTGGIIKIAFGVFLILFALFAIFKLGVDRRVILLVGIGLYFLYTGRTQLNSRNNDCPKLQI